MTKLKKVKEIHLIDSERVCGCGASIFLIFRSKKEEKGKTGNKVERKKNMQKKMTAET